MNPATAIPSKNFDAVKRQVKDFTPRAVIDLIARQLDRADEAKRRIDEEGIVVRDMKGSVIAHPAVAIEQAATKLAADLLAKHAGRKVGA
jgi:hypothetical protein